MPDVAVSTIFGSVKILKGSLRYFCSLCGMCLVLASFGARVLTKPDRAVCDISQSLRHH